MGDFRDPEVRKMFKGVRGNRAADAMERAARLERRRDRERRELEREDTAGAEGASVAYLALERLYDPALREKRRRRHEAERREFAARWGRAA